MIIDKPALSAFVALGMITTYGDIRYKKISNRWIITGLIFGLIGYLFLAFNTLLGSHNITLPGLGRTYLQTSFYLSAAIHVMLSSLAAIILWYLQTWPAGDAKLFIMFATLLPLTDQNLQGLPRLLFLVMLVNIFVSAGIFLGLVALTEWIESLVGLCRNNPLKQIESVRSMIIQRLKDEWPRKHRYAMAAWNTFVLFFLFRVIRSSLNVEYHGVLGQLAIYFALYLAWERVCTLFVRKDITMVSFFLLSAIALPIGAYWKRALAVHLIASGRMTVGFWLFMTFASAFFEYYLRQTRLVPASIGSLEPGAILSEESWEALEKTCVAAGRSMPARYSDGLSQEDIAILIKQEAGPQRPDNIFIYRPRPFAMWIFLGCLWTISFKENVAQCLISVLRFR